MVQRFARKIIRPIGRAGQQNEIQTMIRNESRAIAKLCAPGSHRNIVSVLRQGAVKDSGMYYIDMEFCDANLEQYIADFRSDGARGNMADTLAIMTDIGNGTAYIHEQGEVHRDLKPRNGIMMRSRTQNNDLQFFILIGNKPGRLRILV